MNQTLLRCLNAKRPGNIPRFSIQDLAIFFNCRERTIMRHKKLVLAGEMEPKKRKKNRAVIQRLAKEQETFRKAAALRDRNGEPIFSTWREIGQFAFRKCNFKGSMSTVRRRGKQANLVDRLRPKTCTTKKQDARDALKFCRPLLKDLLKHPEKLKKILFLDEVTVTCKGHRLRNMKCLKGHKPVPIQHRKGCRGKTLNVCNCLYWEGVRAIVFRKRNSSKVFRDTVLATLLKMMKSKKKVLFMDGCPLHWGKGENKETNEEWLIAKGIKFMQPSAHLPSVNCVENCNQSLHEYIAKKGPIRSERMLEAVVQQWAKEYNLEAGRKIISSFPQRLKKVIDLGGIHVGRAVDRDSVSKSRLEKLFF